MSTATFTQEHRRIAISTPLGKDVLLLKGFSGEEEMSRLFEYDLEMLSEKSSIAAKDIVGKNVTFSVEFNDGSPRYFNGFVSRFAYCGTGDRLSIYKAKVVPWLWFLTRTADCRIFQNKSVPDIIKQIFSDLGFSDFQPDFKGQHPAWDYCVQYRETDFQFVSRLMEQEGIFYFFKHENGKHTLVLADHKGAFKDLRDKEVQIAAKESIHELPDQLYSWEHHYEFRTGKWAQTDYNFETPSTSLMTNTNSLVTMDGMSKFEVYDFPGEYEKKSEGDGETKLRMEADESAHDIASGRSHCRSFSPGGKFKLKKHHSSSEQEKGYVITRVRHSVGMAGAYVSSSGPENQGYVNEFTCIPDSVNYRTPRTTPRPCIHGSQTALVVGPPGEEIYPDKYGRVKVQFYWDREGKKDEKSSCWIRVATPWTGKSWGMISIPRIGQEVVVSFLEGDPDRPLITGMVYNADTMPPYGLPDSKTISGIKSKSHKAGGYNEFILDDTAGKEMIRTHAQYDMDTTVKHDKTTTVNNNRTDKITADDEETVGGKQTIGIGADQKLTVGGSQTFAITGPVKITSGVSITLEVGGSSIMIGPSAIDVISSGPITITGAVVKVNS